MFVKQALPPCHFLLSRALSLPATSISLISDCPPIIFSFSLTILDTLYISKPLLHLITTMRSSITMIVVTLFLLMLANVMAAGKTIWESEDPDASDMTISPARSHEYSTSTGHATSVFTQTMSYSLDDFQRSLSKACGTNYALVEPIFKELPTITTSLSVITIQPSISSAQPPRPPRRQSQRLLAPW